MDQYSDVGWEWTALLDKMDTAPDFYFDSVSQIEMDNWWKGRVILLGDACCAPSLLAGQGSTLAMVAAYILAGELRLQTEITKKPFNDIKISLTTFSAKNKRLRKVLQVHWFPKANLQFGEQSSKNSDLWCCFIALYNPADKAGQ